MIKQVEKRINEYIKQTGNRTKENANQHFSYPGLKGYLVGFDTAEYALEHIFNDELAELHEKGIIHIHDLNSLCPYCYGLDYIDLLHNGIHGDDGSTAPEYFDTALGITETVILKLSGQIAGAVAINSPDILLAPYIKKEGLTYKEVRHELKQFIYRINTRVRGSYEAPFVNFQIDVTVPKRLKQVRPVIQGNVMDFTYSDCKEEIDMFNYALLDILDETNKPFPVVNMGIADDFDWDSKIADKIFKSVGSFGQPVISNYVNSDYDPDTTRSMCCSIRLDMSKIMKGSSSFGANNGSGSIGVITINLALLGHLANKDKNVLFTLIKETMTKAKLGLDKKRKFIEDWHSKGMYPTLYQFSKDFRNLFSTIGVIGMNEMCLSMLDKGIDTNEGMALSEEIADYMNSVLTEFQLQSQDWYDGNGVYFNLEVIPGEGATRRLAQQMKKYFPDSLTANGQQKDYITRGCWLPVDKQYRLQFAAAHQSRIQKKFSGGCNFNWYLESPITNSEVTKSIIYKLISNTELPFISISPTLYICPVCKKRHTKGEYCEHDLTEEQMKQYGIESKVI